MKKLFSKLFKYWFYEPSRVPQTKDGVLKLYLDDLRPTPEGWTHCFKIEEVQAYLQNFLDVQYLSLDHDLGASYLCPKCYSIAGDWRECSKSACKCTCHLEDYIRAPTGYDLCIWMAENDQWPVNKPTVHSANPVGRVNMQSVIDRYWHPPGTPKTF